LFWAINGDVRVGTPAAANSLLRLEITMYDFVSMTVLYRADDLLEKSTSFRFGHLEQSAGQMRITQTNRRMIALTLPFSTM
jgi:ABC-type uncharacterized transport system YnjBCD permease subunit